MTSELFIVGIIGFIAGCFIGWAFWYWKNRETKQMQKILDDPESLVKKLKAHGKIYDRGHPITIGTETNADGKTIVSIEKGEEIKTKVLPKPIKAKDLKKKVKKKLKGKK